MDISRLLPQEDSTHGFLGPKIILYGSANFIQNTVLL
jgi:hypothetical protein